MTILGIVGDCPGDEGKHPEYGGSVGEFSCMVGNHPGNGGWPSWVRWMTIIKIPGDRPWNGG